jgi:hypothetical protein
MGLAQVQYPGSNRIRRPPRCGRRVLFHQTILHDGVLLLQLSVGNEFGSRNRASHTTNSLSKAMDVEDSGWTCFTRTTVPCVRFVLADVGCDVADSQFEATRLLART